MAEDMDEQLVRTLYDEHAGPLWSYALHLTRGDTGRAEDLVQETLIRAWRHPEVLQRGPESVRRWLFRVARNASIDEWRRRRARPEAVTSPDALEPHTDDGTDELLQSWLVADALRSLSMEHRTAVVECYYGGHTVAQAAARIGVPEGTVKSRLHYGVRALRLALEERGVTG
jgi:RNA polymerase sigma-70 factor, ECF subfamily